MKRSHLDNLIAQLATLDPASVLAKACREQIARESASYVEARPAK